MKRIASICLLFAVAALLGGCLVDIYGGNPRIQVENGTRGWRIARLGIGDTGTAVWARTFDPLVQPGSSSEVVESPIAGNLHLFLVLRDSGSTLRVLRPLVRLEVGGFCRLALDTDSIGGLRIR